MTDTGVICFGEGAALKTYSVLGADRKTGGDRHMVIEANSETQARTLASEENVLVASIHAMPSKRSYAGWWSRMTASACGIFVGLTVFLAIGWVVVVLFWATIIGMLRSTIQAQNRVPPVVAGTLNPVAANESSSVPLAAAAPALQIHSDWNKWSDETRVTLDLGTVAVPAGGPPLTISISAAFAGQTSTWAPGDVYFSLTAYSDFDAKFWFDEDMDVSLVTDGSRTDLGARWRRDIDSARHQTTEMAGTSVPFSLFLVLNNARDAGGQIGDQSFTFTPEQRQAMRDFADRVRPSP